MRQCWRFEKRTTTGGAMNSESVFVAPWHHGGFGWSCSTSEPTPLSDFGDRRSEVVIQGNGVAHAGRTAVSAPCPLCESKGRLTWVRIAIK